jgi:DNA-binding IscR family transcriptional regulator
VPVVLTPGRLGGYEALVRAGILKSVRGPAGGYELARERRRINMSEIVRAALNETDEDADGPESRLMLEVIEPLATQASQQFLVALEAVSVDDLCKNAEAGAVFGAKEAHSDFTI